jgi:hypothetical protein
MQCRGSRQDYFPLQRVTAGSASRRSGMFTVMLRDLGGKAGHMTTAKSTSKTAMGRGDLRSPSAGKTESPQNDRPPKPTRRVLPKPLRPHLIAKGPSTAVPAVILWDDPVELPAAGKPKD